MNKEEIEPIIMSSSDIEKEDENLQPAGRRWDPLGAAAPSDGNDTTIAQYDTDS